MTSTEPFVQYLASARCHPHLHVKYSRLKSDIPLTTDVTFSISTPFLQCISSKYSPNGQILAVPPALSCVWVLLESSRTRTLSLAHVPMAGDGTSPIETPASKSIPESQTVSVSDANCLLMPYTVDLI